MRKLLLIGSIIAACYFGWQHRDRIAGLNDAGSGRGVQFADVPDRRSSGRQLEGQGTVTKILADDNNGTRHQWFIIRLPSGRTLLVAHNIDIAPRIGSLRVGDTVGFNGEYEWNAQGGVIHWTHRDPNNRHSAGWLKHGGQTYQ